MIKKLKKIFELEATTGVLLCLAAALALFVANSSESKIYFQFLHISMPLNIGIVGISKARLLNAVQGLARLFTST